MGDSFADLRRASRKPGGAQAVIERKRGGAVDTPPSWARPSTNYANAPRDPNWVGAKNGGGVGRQAKPSGQVITGKPAEREMAAARQKAKAAKPARSTKR